jgi:hypothetical protein
MIAPIRPPLIKPPRRPLRESPLERARRAVAESLLSTDANGHRRHRAGWMFWAAAGLLLGTAFLAVIGFLAGR